MYRQINSKSTNRHLAVFQPDTRGLFSVLIRIRVESSCKTKCTRCSTRCYALNDAFVYTLAAGQR